MDLTGSRTRNRLVGAAVLFLLALAPSAPGLANFERDPLPDPRVDGAWPIVWDDHAGFYVRPESGGLLLSACDEEEVDPDRCASDPAVKLAVAAKTADRLPEFQDAPVAHFWAGVRTLTADDCPVIKLIELPAHHKTTIIAPQQGPD